MSQRNKDAVHAYVDAFNRADFDRLREIYTPDAVVHGVLGWGEIDKVIAIWRELHECFQLKLQVDSIITEGDIVAVRYTERGTSTKSFRGQPVTGKSYEIVAMEWFEMKNDKIYRRWGARDSATQFRQMGIPLG
jgi:steroid delta-isomerase-like uncharacterized protein